MTEPTESFGDFDPSTFENNDQRLLTAEFAQLTDHNRQALRDFDPNQHNSSVHIALATIFSEAEENEPQVTNAKREAMIRQLGLNPILEDPESNPDVIISQEYAEGRFDQIRIAAGEHGTRIPVGISARRTDTGQVQVESVTLLSHDLATRMQQQIEAERDAYLIDQRLSSEFGISQQFAEMAQLSLEDKQAMLGSFDQINDLQTVEASEIDLSYLDRTRKKLVKAMLPPMQLMKSRRERQLPHFIEQYQNELGGLIHNFGMQGLSEAELVQRERLLRLSALNRQLDVRKKYTKAVTYGELAAMGIVGGGAGGAVGRVLGELDKVPLTPLQAAIGGAVIGGGLAAEFARQELGLYRKRAERAKGFSEMPQRSYVSEQITDERNLANKYFHATRST